MRRSTAKVSKPAITIGKWIVIAEFSLVMYAYSIYYKLNRHQEYRYMYSKKHPNILNVYYLIGEKLGGLETRKEDLEYWKKIENSKNDS